MLHLVLAHVGFLLQEVLVPSVLEELTAEDFRLVLNGPSVINIAMLKECTSFEFGARASSEYAFPFCISFSFCRGLTCRKQ